MVAAATNDETVIFTPTKLNKYIKNSAWQRRRRSLKHIDYRRLAACVPPA